MTHHDKMFLALQRLVDEDAVGQLRRAEGRMAVLGSEVARAGASRVPTLDWVEGVARLLAHETCLEDVEAEARSIWERGIRHIIWAGMGGSVITVRVLHELGFCDGHNGERVAIYPLDSTDPAALNTILRRIATAKHVSLPAAGSTSPDPALLGDVMMVGVAMGMTSEEPITHLTWFTELLEQAHIPVAEHLLVMTLPGSYLDIFARERQVPSHPLQLDGRSGTGGRMSAPTTRVFLLPAALYLTRTSHEPGQLRRVLQHAWDEYNLAQATDSSERHPFVRLAAALSAASSQDMCCLLLTMSLNTQPLIPWIEQLMEESLGKDCKGVIVFRNQSLNAHAHQYRDSGTLHVLNTAGDIPPGDTPQQHEHVFMLTQPYFQSSAPQDRLAAVATSFLGWQLSMALYGYLHDITFAGQPAVENDKARARVLRNEADPLQALANWKVQAQDGPLTLFAPQSVEILHSPARMFAHMLRQSNEFARIDYLDLTINGEIPDNWASIIDLYARQLGNTLLGVPVKVRKAPAAYHSTEQSEMDGSPYVISLRLLTREHEAPLLGTYSDTFLRAQAVSTWQAMVEQGRGCFLLVVDGTVEQATQPLLAFMNDVVNYFSK